MITEGAVGRIFEVTSEHEIVWEFVNPNFRPNQGGQSNSMYRAYRIPYDWIPQLLVPVEQAVIPPELGTFRIAPQ